ncbi:hypothetical protein WMY93_004021 [Mugilogobius chulae]|uniref:Hyaluronan/mRNA-binding protein domain-containing protein n=1 Tax=Mugilogobius chulae TaxID=88201 RepID=A0AAW0Q2E2_9GOBI
MLPDEFGCVVANRFGKLLDNEADPFDILNETECEKEKKKKKKKQEDVKSKQKKPGQKESQRDRRVPVEAPEIVQVRKQQSRAGPVTERVEKERQIDTKRAAYGERRTPQDFSLPRPFNEDADAQGREGYGGRRGGGRGGGGFMKNQESQRGKREYDRHKEKGWQGAWNWGSVDETSSSELTEVTEDAPVKSENQQLSADEENRAPQEEEGEMVVHVAMEMSLDEWKALQETNRPKAEFNIRKAEDKVPCKAKVIHESMHLENLKNALDNLNEEGRFLRRSVNDITSLLDINFGSLERPTRGGRGRGGSRGGIRGGLNVQTQQMNPIIEVEDYVAPNVYDPEDFPALSAGL